MTEKEAQVLIEKFRKECISSWTSKEYQIPPLSKNEAVIKAMEVCLFLRNCLDIKEEKDV